MAYGTDGEWVDDPQESNFFAANPPPSAPQNAGDIANERSRNDPTYNPRDEIIGNQSGEWQGQLQALGGNLYNPTDLAGMQRQVSYAQNAGVNPQVFMDQAAAEYERRRNNVPGGQSAGGENNQAARGAGGGYGGGGYGYASGGGFNEGAPNFIQPFTEQYRAPTLADLYANPGFQGRLNMGTDAIQKSAAARGNLLTGTTLQDLDKWAQDYATNEYDKVYGRSQEEFDDRFNIFNTNETNRYNSQRTNRMDDFGIYDTNRNFDYNVMNTDRNYGLAQQTADRNYGLSNQQLGMNQNLQNFNIADTMENNAWSRGFKLMDYGYGAAGGLANASQNFGNQGAENAYQRGNAQSAGTVGQANAWNAGLGQLSNLAQTAGLAKWYTQS